MLPIRSPSGTISGMLFYTITQSPLLHVAHPSQSMCVLLCPFTRSNLCHWACNFSRHHQHTSLSSRHHHDYPARHSPQADKPHFPVPPPLILTINNVEISHFSHLLMLWWDECSEFALLHKMNLHRIHFICEKSWMPLLLPLPPLFCHPSICPACWRA